MKPLCLILGTEGTKTSNRREFHHGCGLHSQPPLRQRSKGLGFWRLCRETIALLSPRRCIRVMAPKIPGVLGAAPPMGKLLQRKQNFFLHLPLAVPSRRKRRRPHVNNSPLRHFQAHFSFTSCLAGNMMRRASFPMVLLSLVESNQRQKEGRTPCFP